jgi:hypothetical protein
MMCTFRGCYWPQDQVREEEEGQCSSNVWKMNLWIQSWQKPQRFVSFIAFCYVVRKGMKESRRLHYSYFSVMKFKHNNVVCVDFREGWRRITLDWTSDVHVTVHRDKSLIIKPNRCTNFWNLFLDWYFICFAQFLCPSSGAFHCTHSSGICHRGLLTACE